MSDYKNIRGKKVKFLTSDLSGEQSEGQLFYSDTDNDFKTVISTAAWSSGGNIPTATRGLTNTGSVDASVVYGGYTTEQVATTLEYNGTNWSSANDMPGNFPESSKGGTQTAVISAGGVSGPPAGVATREYDGTNWTAGGNLGTGRYVLDGDGTQTAGWVCGGNINPGSGVVSQVKTEEYNGTAWTESGDLSNARNRHSTAGLQTAGLAFGGAAAVPMTISATSSATEEYDGSSWTSGGTMGTARYSIRGGGIQTNALAFGGNVPAKTVNTELYDGTSWTEMNNLAAAVTSHGGDGLGTSKSWLAVGGATNPGNTNLTTTQEFLISINSVTGAAWASGGAMNTGRSEGMTAGTQTASLMSGGIVPGSDAMTNNSEEYNGSAWSEGNNLSNFRRGGGNGAQGTQTAAFVSGGNGAGTSPAAGLLTTAEEYNGTSWSDGGDMPATKFSHGSLGTQTAGLAFSGKTGTNVNTDVTSVNTTYEYDGSSWTAGGNYGIANNGMAGFGTQTAGVGVGGNYPASAATYEYDGSSWTAGNNLPGARRNHGSFGTLTAGAICGGYSPSAGTLSQTLKYDGTSWTESVNLTTGRNGLAGLGTQALGLVAGGHPQLTTTEEYTVDTSTLNLKTLTDS